MDETGCGLLQLKAEGFLKKNLREDRDDELILWKLKVLFANFLQPALLDCGLISRKAKGFFAKFSERGTWTAGWFLLSSRFFLQNDREKHDLGCPPGRSDGRERPATWPASLASELARMSRERFVHLISSQININDGPHRQNSRSPAEGSIQNTSWNLNLSTTFLL